MPVAFHADVHVPRAIVDQLRRRGVDILSAIDDGAAAWADDRLLDRALELGRVLLTRDIRFRALAERWQGQGRPFAGLCFSHQLRGTIGELVDNSEAVAKASEPGDWLDVVEYLPFRRSP